MKKAIIVIMTILIGCAVLFLLFGCDIKTISDPEPETVPDSLPTDPDARDPQNAPKESFVEEMIEVHGFDDELRLDLDTLKYYNITSCECTAYDGFFHSEKDDGIESGRMVADPERDYCIFWCGDEEVLRTFITAIMYKEEDICGYAVVKVIRNYKKNWYTWNVVRESLFQDIDGQKQVVTRNDVEKLIKLVIDREIARTIAELNGESDTQIEWSIENGGITVHSYKGGYGKVSIPFDVRKLGEKAFADVYVEEIELPGTIEEIAEDAFPDVTSIRKVTATVDALYMLGDLPNLNILTIIPGKGNNDLGMIDFSKYKFLRKVRVEIPLTEGAFKDCALLYDVELSSQSVIPAHAFENCRQLREIHGAYNCDYIGESAFKNCVSLQYIAKATIIGKNAYENCTSIDGHLWLSNLTDNIQEIREGAFKGCTSLTGLHIAGNSQIGDRAFENCTELLWVYLDPGMQSIGREAFRQSNKIVDISLPSTVRSIGENAFAGEAISAIGFGGTMEQWEQISEGVLCENYPKPRVNCSDGVIRGDELFKYEKKDDGTLAIVEYYYVDEARGRLVVPARSPFYGLPITEIRSDAFYRIDHVDEIVISEGITTIRECAFTGVNIVQVTIPSTVTMMEPLAFSAADKLLHVVNKSSLTLDIYYLISGGLKEQLSAEHLRIIKESIGWAEDAGLIEVVSDESRFLHPMRWDENGVCLLDDGEDVWLIGCCSDKKELDLSGYTFTKMAQWALRNQECETLILPGTSDVSISALYRATNLKEVTIFSGVKKIDDSAFSDCTKLREVHIPDSVKRIERRAFAECPKLETVYLGSGISYIDKEALSGPEKINVVYNGTRDQWKEVLKKNSWIRFMYFKYAIKYLK